MYIASKEHMKNKTKKLSGKRVWSIFFLWMSKVTLLSKVTPVYGIVNIIVNMSNTQRSNSNYI